MGKRFFKHGELPLVLLALVAERPCHGYDLMAELGRLFGPAYTPSPGAIYPAIEALQAEHLIRGTNQNGKSVYEIAPVGRDALEKRADQLAALEVRTGARLRNRDSVDSMLQRFCEEVRTQRGRTDPAAIERVLSQAAADIASLSNNRTGSDHEEG